MAEKRLGLLDISLRTYVLEFPRPIMSFCYPEMTVRKVLISCGGIVLENLHSCGKDRGYSVIGLRRDTRPQGAGGSAVSRGLDGRVEERDGWEATFFGGTSIGLLRRYDEASHRKTGTSSTVSTFTQEPRGLGHAPLERRRNGRFGLYLWVPAKDRYRSARLLFEECPFVQGARQAL